MKYCDVMIRKKIGLVLCRKPAVALVKLPWSNPHFECAEHLAEAKKENRVSIVEVK